MFDSYLGSTNFKLFLKLSVMQVGLELVRFFYLSQVPSSLF